MSFHVKVSGIPTQITLGKLIPIFSNILSLKSTDFLLRVLPLKGPVKEVLLTLPTYTEAQLSQEKLNNFVFRYNNITYVFTATLESGHKQNNKKLKLPSKFKNQNLSMPYDLQFGYQHKKGYQYRSRSPHYDDASVQLDIQFEILRKQRLIVEEERKLLEEQRKLDELKMKSFQNNTSAVANRSFDDVVMSGPSSQPTEKMCKPKERILDQASGVLLGKMNMFIKKHSSSEERKALSMRLRSVLKQRLAAVVGADGKSVDQSNKLIMLYRTQHAQLEDEEFVKEALRDIKEGRLTDDIESVKASVKGNSDGTQNAAGDSNDTDSINNKNNEKPEKKFEEKRLFFFKASGVLAKKMNNHIKQSPPGTRKLLEQYLRFTLKKRLADIMAGQPIYQTHKIIKMYRSQHPVTEDRDLIKQLLKDIDEGLVSEETFIRTRRHKTSDTPNVEMSAAIDNEKSQHKILTSVKVIDESGEPQIEGDTAIAGNTDNENHGENVDHTEVLENQNNEKYTAECNSGNYSEVKNIIKTNDKIENDSKNDLVCDNTENDTNYNVDNTIHTDIATIEANQKCNVEVNIEDDNCSVKRKNDEVVDDNKTKIAKTDDIVMIVSEGANENK